MSRSDALAIVRTSCIYSGLLWKGSTVVGDCEWIVPAIVINAKDVLRRLVMTSVGTATCIIARAFVMGPGPQRCIEAHVYLLPWDYIHA